MEKNQNTDDDFQDNENTERHLLSLVGGKMTVPVPYLSVLPVGTYR